MYAQVNEGSGDSVDRSALTAPFQATAESGRVTRLSLRGNRLSGPIAPQLGDLTQVQVLDRDENELSGGIPSQLGNLTQLQEVSLGANRLSGCIPAGWSGAEHNGLDEVDLPFCAE